MKDIIWNFSNYNFKVPKAISIPKPLEEGFREVCSEQNLSFNISNYSADEDKGYAHKPNSKLLMFGNEDVSPYEFNLGQPYVISEKFEAERIK